MKLRCIGLAVVLGLVFSSAWAEEPKSNNVLDKRFTFYGGAQFYQADGEFSSTKDGRPKVKVDMDDLNLNENEVSPIVGALINLGKRWTLRFDYFGYHDDATSTAEFDIPVGGVEIPAGYTVDSSLDLDIVAANIAYNFWRSERARFGVGIGFHFANFELEMSGKLNVGGSEIKTDDGNIDFFAPVPNLYAYGAYGFTDRFLLRYGGGWLSLTYGDYDGSLVFANAFLEYWPFDYVGFGAGYRYLKADIEYDPGNKTEEYDVTLPGPMFYVTLGF